MRTFLRLITFDDQPYFQAPHLKASGTGWPESWIVASFRVGIISIRINKRLTIINQFLKLTCSHGHGLVNTPTRLACSPRGTGCMPQ